MTASGPAIPLAVFVTASGHGGGRCSPLSASGMGSAAGEPGGRVWGRLLSPSLPLSLKCGCSVSSLCGECCFLISACSYLEPRLFLHPERGFGCTLLLWMEIQPLWCCFDGFVLRLRLLVASVPGSPAGGRDGACLTLDQVVRCSSASGAEFEFWRPGALCWSPVPSTLQQLKTSRSSSDLSRLLIGVFFLPLLAAPSLEAPRHGQARFCG